MIRFIYALIGFFFFIFTLFISLLSIIAALGFIHPIFDVFNNFQPILFAGTLICLLLTPLILKNRKWQSLLIAIGATGFISSAIIFVPEFVLGIKGRASENINNKREYKLLTQNIFGENFDMERLAKAIIKENPDIVTLQEYFPGQREQLHPLLLEHFPYYSLCIGGKRANIAIYSKLKFEELSASFCAQNDEQRVSRIIVSIDGYDGDEFTIMTTHLDWPLQISRFKRGKDFFEKINLMFERKEEQMKELAKALENFNGPLLLAADLNTTSWTYALREFAKDNNLKLLTRFVLTYPNRFYIFGWRDVLPIISLDHILSKGDVRVHKLTKGDPAGSDHNPVIIYFSV